MNRLLSAAIAFAVCAPLGHPLAAAPADLVSADERAFNCKRLSGIVQVKILQLRGQAQRPQPSGLAAAAHKAIGPMIGSQASGSDPTREGARERARVAALNALLVEKKCRSYDVEAELKGTGTPSATVPAPGKSAGQKK